MDEQLAPPVASEMKRDDLAGAIAELSPAERLRATATMQRLALLIGNVGGILTILTEQGLQTEPAALGGYDNYRFRHRSSESQQWL